MTLGLFVICHLLMSLVLGEVVKYTSVTTSPDEFVEQKSFATADTLFTCAILAYAGQERAFRYEIHNKSCASGYVDFGAQAADDDQEHIKVYSRDLPTYYAGMMLCDGRTIIILPNGRVCPQAAFPATTADKVGNRLVTLAYYKGFVYACGGKAEATTFYQLDLNNLDLNWQPLAPTPEAVYHPGVIPYNDKIFLWGGRWSLSVPGCQTEIYAYDIGTNTWSVATTFSDGLAGLENNEPIIHGKYALLFGYTCALDSQHEIVVHLYNMDAPGDPPVEMTEMLPTGVGQATDCVKVTLSVKGLGVLCAGAKDTDSDTKTVIFMPLNDHPDVDGWEPWEEMAPLKVVRASVHLMNLGEELVLAGGFNAPTKWNNMGTFAWNNATSEFQDDQEIEPLPYDMKHAGSVTIPLHYVQEMCFDYL